MATGHVNPGYYLPVSNLERINKLPINFEKKLMNGLTPEISQKRWLLTQPNLSNDILENIRRKARESWKTVELKTNNSPTTYLGNFQFKSLDEPTKLRPSSPTRANNPHPSAIFLTCHLHHLPGFHRDDVRPISSQPHDMRIVHATVPHDEIVRPVSRKSENSRHKPDDDYPIDKMTVDSLQDRNQTHLQYHEITRPKSTISLHGSRSSAQTPSLSQDTATSSKLRRPFTSLPKCHSRRYEGHNSRSRNLIYQNTEYPRGDYSIHYQWPTTIPHHRLC